MQIPNPSQNPKAFIFCKWALQFVRLEVHETEAKISKELKHETPKKGLPFQRLKLQNPTIIPSTNSDLHVSKEAAYTCTHCILLKMIQHFESES